MGVPTVNYPNTNYHAYSLLKGQHVLPGQFTCAGTSSVTSTTIPRSVTWFGYGVTRTSTGLYTVTLTTPFANVQTYDAWLVSLTASVRPNILLSPGNLTISTTGVQTFQIQSYSVTVGGATAVVTDVPVGFQVHFRLDVAGAQPL